MSESWKLDSETRFFSCTCACNAVAVSDLMGLGEIAIEVWEPRGSRSPLRYRIKKAWRVLRGEGAMDETLLTKENARLMGEYLLQLAERAGGGQ